MDIINPFILPTILTTIYLVVIGINDHHHNKNNKNNNNNKNNDNKRNVAVAGTTTTLKQQPQPQQHGYEYDVCIIGAGIVGCTLGASLAQQGKTVLVIERDLSQPDRIVGELLQPGGVKKLTQLGFAHCLEGIDSPKIRGYGVFYEGQKVHLPYPKLQNDNNNSNNNNNQTTSVVDGDHDGEERPIGRSFHYGRFIMNLRRNAQEQPTLKMIQGSVSKLLENDQGVVTGVQYVDMSNTTTNTNTTNTNTSTTNNTSTNFKTVTAALTIVANGAGSSLTRQLNDSKPIIASQFIGLKLKNAAQHLPFNWHGNVFMVEPAPVLCYPISSTDVRVLIDFPDKLPNMNDGSMATFLKTQVCPTLPDTLHDAFIKAVDSGDIRCAQNREMPGDFEFKKKGAIMLGDALNTRHPLTGGGMTVAFGDVVTLRDLLRDVQDLTDHEAIDQAMMILADRRRRYASTINILANALYAIFAPGKDDPMRVYMKKATFNYFQLGGICATGPVGLLAGLTESYHVLLTHFFSVAIVGCFYECFPIPSPASIWRSIKLIKSAAFIVGPLIAEEKCLSYLFPKALFKRK